jgi:hypothetical protein
VPQKIRQETQKPESLTLLNYYISLLLSRNNLFSSWPFCAINDVKGYFLPLCKRLVSLAYYLFEMSINIWSTIILLYKTEAFITIEPFNGSF